MDDLPAFSMLPDPNGDFGGAEAGRSSAGTPEIRGNGGAYSSPINVFTGGQGNSSLPPHIPHNDEQTPSTKSRNNDFITTSQDGGPPVDPASIWNGLTPSAGQDQVSFNHWGSIQVDTWSTSLESGNTPRENTPASTRATYDGLKIGAETMIHPFGVADHMCFPTDTRTGFYNILSSIIVNHNPQQSYGAMIQAPNTFMNAEEAFASIPMPVAAPIPQGPATQTIPCTVPWCTMTFKRKHERDRHAASVHGINHRAYLCHINGCPKNRGTPFSRQDKLTEHMWKKHANLGYRKRVV